MSIGNTGKSSDDAETTNWMGLEMTILSEVSQTDEDKYTILLICGIKKKMVEMNLFTKQKRTRRHRKQSCDYQRGDGGAKLSIWG